MLELIVLEIVWYRIGGELSIRIWISRNDKWFYDTSTGSFNKIKSQKLFVKEMVGKRKPISGSMDHDNYFSGSYKSDSHGRITIPTFGRGHTVNTQQFNAVGFNGKSKIQR